MPLFLKSAHLPYFNADRPNFYSFKYPTLLHQLLVDWELIHGVPSICLP